MDDTDSIFWISWSISCMVEPNLLYLSIDVVLDDSVVFFFEFANKIFLNKHLMILINIDVIIRMIHILQSSVSISNNIGLRLHKSGADIFVMIISN